MALACLLWVGFGPLARSPLEIKESRQSQWRTPFQAVDHHQAIQATSSLEQLHAPPPKPLACALQGDVSLPAIASCFTSQTEQPDHVCFPGSLQALSIRWQI